MFGDNFFKKVEKKTHINKDTIFSLAAKLQKSNMQDENTIREVIHDLSNMTGKEVSKEKEKQIIDAIRKNKVPKDMNNMF